MTAAAPRVVSVHLATGISGVTTAGARMAVLPAPHIPWKPLLIGEDLDETSIRASALDNAPGLSLCSWPRGTSPALQVLAVRDALRHAQAGVVVTNDAPHAFAAAGLDHHRGLRALAWHHSSGHDGDDVAISCFSLADRWTAVSQGLCDRITALVPNLPPALPAVPVYAPGPPRAVPPLPSAGLLRLLYAGRLEKHHKRVLDLARLADELASRGVRFRMTIAGAGSAEHELRAAVSDHVRAGRVVLVGAVAAPEMPRLYAAHDVTVLVSASEGWPLTVMESLAMGRPVAITTGCGGAVEVVRDGIEGVVAAVGDMSAMASALARVAVDREAPARMGAAAFAAARAFAIAALGCRYDAMVCCAAGAPASFHVSDGSGILARWRAILAAVEAIGPCVQPDLAKLRSSWFQDLRDPAVGEVDLPLELPRVERTAARLVRRAIESLRARGVCRIALYGAGEHTRRAARVIASSPEVVAIIDDRASFAAGPPSLVHGLPVVGPRDAERLGIGAVIISSDEHEREMFALAAGWAGDLPVLTLYEPAAVLLATARAA